MDSSSEQPTSALTGFKRFAVASRSRAATYIGMGFAILLLDLLTGRFLMFPNMRHGMR